MSDKEVVAAMEKDGDGEGWDPPLVAGGWRGGKRTWENTNPSRTWTMVNP